MPLKVLLPVVGVVCFTLAGAATLRLRQRLSDTSNDPRLVALWDEVDATRRQHAQLVADHPAAAARFDRRVRALPARGAELSATAEQYLRTEISVLAQELARARTTLAAAQLTAAAEERRGAGAADGGQAALPIDVRHIETLKPRLLELDGARHRHVVPVTTLQVPGAHPGGEVFFHKGTNPYFAAGVEPGGVRLASVIWGKAVPFAERWALFDFVPFQEGPRVTARTVRASTDAGAPEVSATLTELTRAEGGFVLLTGLTGYTRVTFTVLTARPEAVGPEVAALCRTPDRLAGSTSPAALAAQKPYGFHYPIDCALAIIGGAADQRVQLKVETAGAAIPSPGIPPSGATDLDPLYPAGARADPMDAQERRVLELFDLALEQTRTARYGEALATLQRCLDLRPDSADTRRLMGYLRAILGDRAGAKAHYREFVRLAPEHPAAPLVRRLAYQPVAPVP